MARFPSQWLGERKDQLPTTKPAVIVAVQGERATSILTRGSVAIELTPVAVRDLVQNLLDAMGDGNTVTLMIELAETFRRT